MDFIIDLVNTQPRLRGARQAPPPKVHSCFAALLQLIGCICSCSWEISRGLFAALCMCVRVL